MELPETDSDSDSESQIDLRVIPKGGGISHHSRATLKSTQNFEWTDIQIESDKASFRKYMKDLSHEFGLSNELVKNCLSPSHLPKVEMSGSKLFIITRYADEAADKREDSIGAITNKIALFIDEKNIISVHRAEIPFIAEVSAHWSEEYGNFTKDHLLNVLLDRIILTYDKELSFAADELDLFELKLFSKQENVIEDLYHLKRRASVFKRMLKLTRHIITEYNKRQESEYTKGLLEMVDAVLFNADEVHENAVNVMNLYVTIASHKTNELMTVLTVFSAHFIPLTFIAGVYGMNFVFMPELQWKPAYPVVMGSMLLIAILIFSWFVWKGVIPFPFQAVRDQTAIIEKTLELQMKRAQAKLTIKKPNQKTNQKSE
eukprot:TRINITY_DN438_c0_g1_i3.p1 TRINITY_DN438_c0_g1~~TRINITY_DN438_c0_g1_i3.p1  ORF type:complete len:400 (-),score=101.23 TRINITY_DN438_c0_g1_i3:410-1531(-)